MACPKIGKSAILFFSIDVDRTLIVRAYYYNDDCTQQAFFELQYNVKTGKIEQNLITPFDKDYLVAATLLDRYTVQRNRFASADKVQSLYDADVAAVQGALKILRR